MRSFLLGAIFLLFVSDPAMAAAEKERIALVIGNGEYLQPEQILDNPENDALLIGSKLESLGFEVETLMDGSQREMFAALSRFEKRLKAANGNVAAFAYYAGHAVQVNGENYLLPVDFNGETESDARRFGVNADEFLLVMENAESRVNFLVLDACRNNPFRGTRSVSGGLAQMQAPAGTLVAYATAPGELAFDGDGTNSPYTRALAAALDEPGKPAEMVFKRARGLVIEQTDSGQVPWDNSSLHGDNFYFIEPQGGQQGESGALNEEIVFWDTISDSDNPADYEAYLNQYNDGTFAAIARNRIDALVGKAKPEIGVAASGVSTPTNRNAMSGRNRQTAPPNNAVSSVSGSAAAVSNAGVSGNRPGGQKIVIMAVGDESIASPVETMLENSVRGGGYQLVSEEFISGISRHVQGSDVNLAPLRLSLREEGVGILVLARVIPVGQRQLNYVGRTSTLYTSQIDLTVYDLSRGARLGGWQGEVQFTSLNAMSQAQRAVRPLVSRVNAVLGPSRG